MNRFIATALLLVTACGAESIYSSFAQTGPTRPPRVVNHVDVYLASRPKQPFAEVGIVSAEVRSVFPPSLSLNEMLDGVRGAAARQGCDAVLVNPPAKDGVKWFVTATCVVYESTTASR